MNKPKYPDHMANNVLKTEPTECKHDYVAIPSNSLGVEVMCRQCGKRKKL